MRFPLRIDDETWWGRLRAKADRDGFALQTVIFQLLDAWLRGDVTLSVRAKGKA